MIVPITTPNTVPSPPARLTPPMTVRDHAKLLAGSQAGGHAREVTGLHDSPPIPRRKRRDDIHGAYYRLTFQAGQSCCFSLPPTA